MGASPVGGTVLPFRISTCDRSASGRPRPATYLCRFAFRRPSIYSTETVLPLTELGVEKEYFSLLIPPPLRELIDRRGVSFTGDTNPEDI